MTFFRGIQENLFNSFNEPIPAVRNDIQSFPIKQNGDKCLFFYDSLSYATNNFTLPSDSVSILSLLDGNRSIDDLIKISTGEVSKNDLLNYVRYLDENGILIRHTSNSFLKKQKLIMSNPDFISQTLQVSHSQITQLNS